MCVSSFNFNYIFELFFFLLMAVATVESSTGELAFFVVSDGVGLPRRIRCRAPSFFHAQVLPTMMVGARLDDLLPTVALMHLVSAECDR